MTGRCAFMAATASGRRRRFGDLLPTATTRFSCENSRLANKALRLISATGGRLVIAARVADHVLWACPREKGEARKVQSYVLWALLGMAGYSFMTLFVKLAERSSEVSTYMVRRLSRSSPSPSSR